MQLLGLDRLNSHDRSNIRCRYQLTSSVMQRREIFTNTVRFQVSGFRSRMSALTRVREVSYHEELGTRNFERGGRLAAGEPFARLRDELADEDGDRVLVGYDSAGGGVG